MALQGTVPVAAKVQVADAVAGTASPLLAEGSAGHGRRSEVLAKWSSALPTRAAAVQIHARVHAAMSQFFGKGAPEAVLYRGGGHAEQIGDLLCRPAEPGEFRHLALAQRSSPFP